MASVNERVPEVSFRGEGGSAVSMASLLGLKTLVLYFYPKDDTAGCTAEACSFRDSYEDFLGAGADVIGVSADDEASHSSFKQKNRLPFRLLTDPGGQAAKALGVKKTFGLIAGRVTFVIDRSGVVRHRFDSQIRVKEHVQQALTLVKELESKSAA